VNQHLTIVWFRQDLRLADNPALFEAAKLGSVLPVYIFDDVNAGEFAPGLAGRWWLHHSLVSLNTSLDGKLSVHHGDACELLQKIVKKNKAQAIFWNQCYEPWRIKRDEAIRDQLEKTGIKVQNFNGSLLWEPWETLKNDGTPYKVFAPFYRKGCLNAAPPRNPLTKPEKLDLVTDKSRHSKIKKLALPPDTHWSKKLDPHWVIGEQAAKKRLNDFLENGLNDYKNGRNFPAKTHVSRLSPHLHFGEISPNQVWYGAINASTNCPEKDLDHFLSELGWREFSYSLLFYNPELPYKNLQAKFDRFPWIEDSNALQRWQQGLTGYPIVDAGMRELWQTGYMHNRVRMVAGSFLVKNLLLHWRHGERWFRDCLVDADLANNSASWQWVAGCGADAAPYFRMFNPVGQGQKFDPQGEYTRRYVPELTDLPNEYLFNPWEAPAQVLEKAGVKLGKTYPRPIVDFNLTRELALAAFAKTKE
jgi:deoxyribodipyrimidine photo-lyase